MIDVGASGAQAELPFSLYDDSTGAPVTGHSWVDAGGGLTAELQLRVPAGSYTNSTIANIVEWGNGQYALQLTSGETATAGKVAIYISISGVSAQFGPEEIRSSSTATAVRDAILDYSHDTGLTIRGFFRRLDALAAGKATGLRGTIARYFMRDGTTEAIEATQDTSLGTRAAADVSGTEP
jgi:hypothetical protein